MRYVCTICGYVYDEAQEKIPFADLPESWTCPACGAPKALFEPEESQADAPAISTAPAQPEGNIQQLSAGELSALCSNLARGCEKQYQEEAAALFREIADYFASVAPAVPEADLAYLAALIQEDLERRYPALTEAAVAEQDRGTRRVSVWGQKVTTILKAHLQRYQQEGDALLANTQVWVCSVCGFIYIGDTPPERCPVCKVPDWKFDKIEGRTFA